MNQEEGVVNPLLPHFREYRTAKPPNEKPGHPHCGRPGRNLPDYLFRLYS